MSPIRLAIYGAAGRMGQRLIALGSADVGLKIVAAVEHAGHLRLGDDAGVVAGAGLLGVPLTSTLEASFQGQPLQGPPFHGSSSQATSPAAPQSPIDVVIDFSTPAGAKASLKSCVEHRLPLVLATTGLDAAEQATAREAACRIPLLWSPSMSLAVNLVMKLTEMAALALKDHPTGADVEIIERHHRFKEDAPSGTALKFGQIVSTAMGQSEARHGRHGRTGQRPHDEIGYHALRVGDNPGEHTIVFGLLGESFELSVRATNRDCYAHGALLAAKFLAGKPPGLYGMQDVLGL